jgi:hypothetical protein
MDHAVVEAIIEERRDAAACELEAGQRGIVGHGGHSCILRGALAVVAAVRDYAGK